MGGRLRLELTLEVKVRFYDNFILQLEREMVVSKEKGRFLSEKWHWSTQKALDHLRKVKELKASLQEITWNWMQRAARSALTSDDSELAECCGFFALLLRRGAA